MATLDGELEHCMETLYRIQAAVGGKPTSVAATEAVIAEQFKNDQFMLIKHRLMVRLSDVEEKVEDCVQSRTANAVAQDVKIRKQQEVRAALRDLTKDWEDLSALLLKETSKKKSKFSATEIRSRTAIVRDLKEHLDGLKARFTASYTGVQLNKAPVLPSFGDLKRRIDQESSASGGQGVASVQVEQEEISTRQHQRLAQIRATDREMDKTVELIGERVENLGEVAKQMGQELKVQSGMIDELDQAVEKAQDHMSNVNLQVADTLKKVRSSDKLCMDIMCVLLFMGLVGVMIELSRS